MHYRIHSAMAFTMALFTVASLYLKFCLTCHCQLNTPDSKVVLIFSIVLFCFNCCFFSHCVNVNPAVPTMKFIRDGALQMSDCDLSASGALVLNVWCRHVWWESQLIVVEMWERSIHGSLSLHSFFYQTLSLNSIWRWHFILSFKQNAVINHNIDFFFCVTVNLSRILH